MQWFLALVPSCRGQLYCLRHRVGPHVDVVAKLHLLVKGSENVLLEDAVADSFDRLQVELLTQMVLKRVCVR